MIFCFSALLSTKLIASYGIYLTYFEHKLQKRLIYKFIKSENLNLRIPTTTLYTEIFLPESFLISGKINY